MPTFAHWLSTFFTRPTINTIIIGIDYPSFSLVKTLKEIAPHHQVCAFIDEEPWTNKTQILGTTVYYPSDLLALIEKHTVTLVIQIDGQAPLLSAPLIKQVEVTKARLITLNNDTRFEEQLRILLAN